MYLIFVFKNLLLTSNASEADDCLKIVFILIYLQKIDLECMALPESRKILNLLKYDVYGRCSWFGNNMYSFYQ